MCCVSVYQRELRVMQSILLKVNSKKVYSSFTVWLTRTVRCCTGSRVVGRLPPAPQKEVKLSPDILKYVCRKSFWTLLNNCHRFASLPTWIVLMGNNRPRIFCIFMLFIQCVKAFMPCSASPFFAVKTQNDVTHCTIVSKNRFNEQGRSTAWTHWHKPPNALEYVCIVLCTCGASWEAICPCRWGCFLCTPPWQAPSLLPLLFLCLDRGQPGSP